MSTQTEPLTVKVKRATAGFILPIVKMLDKIGLTPNLITWIGCAGSLLAAYLIAIQKFQAAALTLILFASMDAIDGALARYQNKNAPFGAFLDSVLDRYAELILFAGFLIHFLSINNIVASIATYFAITLSLTVSYTRARASDLGADIKNGFITRMERYIIIILCLFFQQPMLCVILIAILSGITAMQRFLIGRKRLR